MLDGSASGRTLEELGYVVTDASEGLVEQDAGDNALWTGRGYDATLDDE
jgi:hypothetical protein